MDVSFRRSPAGCVRAQFQSGTLGVGDVTRWGPEMTMRPSDALRKTREEFPYLERCAYLNTAAVALGSRRLASAYKSFVDE
jgi:hypothetical protein